MHSHEVGAQSTHRHLSHLNALFTGRGSHVYDVVMVRLTRRLYQRVIADLAALRLVKGKVLDAGTGPGTLVREIAWSFPGLQVYGIDLSEDMIGLARAHARREQLEERVHFESFDVAHLPYPDQSFDVVVSTISMHHWSELEQPLRELHRVLRPGGRVWIYDFRFVKAQTVEKALARTPFAQTPLENRLVRTGRGPFALYRRFALQKTAQSDQQKRLGEADEVGGAGEMRDSPTPCSCEVRYASLRLPAFGGFSKPRARPTSRLPLKEAHVLLHAMNEHCSSSSSIARSHRCLQSD